MKDRLRIAKGRAGDADVGQGGSSKLVEHKMVTRQKERLQNRLISSTERPGCEDPGDQKIPYKSLHLK